MAELANRPRWESDFAARFGELAGRHRRELDKLLGNPPDARNVPAEFWQKVQRETEEEMVAILLLLFIASAEQHGMDQEAAQQVAQRFALGRGSAVARSYTGTSVERALGNFDGTPLPTPDRSERLDKVFGQTRADEIAADNTTAANTAGGEAAADEAGTASQEDTWYTQDDHRVCPICGPLHELKRDDWQLKFPSGPPAHPSCRCWIEYAREKTRQPAVVGESMTLGIVQHDGDRLPAKSLTVGGVLDSLLESACTALGESIGAKIGAVIQERDAALLEGLRSVFEEQRQERRQFVETIQREDNRPILIEVAPAVIHVAPAIPVVEQAAPVVNVTVTPEVMLKQEPRRIELVRTGDKITGSSE